MTAITKSKWPPDVTDYIWFTDKELQYFNRKSAIDSRVRGGMYKLRPVYVRGKARMFQQKNKLILKFTILTRPCIGT